MWLLWQPETYLNAWSFGFGGYPTGRPYGLYRQRRPRGYGWMNDIHYVGGPYSLSGGPNLGELYRQWYF